MFLRPSPIMCYGCRMGPGWLSGWFRSPSKVFILSPPVFPTSWVLKEMRKRKQLEALGRKMHRWSRLAEGSAFRAGVPGGQGLSLCRLPSPLVGEVGSGGEHSLLSLSSPLSLVSSSTGRLTQRRQVQPSGGGGGLDLELK